jgi:DNA-binding response OmpR family regulator
MASKVLIVCGEANIVIALEFLMQGAGYRVDVARTAAEACAMVAQAAPDLVLLDVVGGGAACLDFLQHVRRTAAQQSLPIIMLAAKGRDVEVSKGLALGANACIAKPFATQDVLAAVQRWLAHP